MALDRYKRKNNRIRREISSGNRVYMVKQHADSYEIIASGEPRTVIVERTAELDRAFSIANFDAFDVADHAQKCMHKWHDGHNPKEGKCST